MNANELADYLQLQADIGLNPRLEEAAYLLRQQKAEIEALKAKCKWYDDTFRLPTETHPVKELTEYIKYRLAVKEFGESFCITYRTELLAYANSILRKAQEK